MPRVTHAVLAAALTLIATAPRADEMTRYRHPPGVVESVLTAPRLPRGAPNVSPDRARLVLPELPSLIPIATLAEPVEKLAGLEVLPAMHCTRQQLKSAWSGFSIAALADGKAVRAALPADARLGAPVWSPAGDRLACAVYGTGGAELWVIEAATGAARAITGVRLNTVLDPTLEWTLDGRSILCAAAIAGDPAPADSRVPDGPQLRASLGRAASQRTARDVLRTAGDQARLRVAATARLTRVPVAGGAPEALGEPELLGSVTVSPDEKSLVVETLESLPLGFPFYLFPRTVEIRDGNGKRIAKLGDIPLNDRSAISSVAALGPREWTWSPDARALWFFSWEDTPGADPLQAIRDTTRAQPGTDRLMRLDAPFTGAPAVVASSDFQLQQMTWTDDGAHLLLGERYEPRRRVRLWALDPRAPGTRTVLVSRSTEGVYDDPGVPLTHHVGHDDVLWTAKGGGAIYLSGQGFRADGQRPFLDRMDLGSGRTTRLFESAPDVLELALAVLSSEGRRLITSRQSNRMPPNFWLREAGRKSPRRLSDYADPAPALTASQRMQFKFMRPDSVWLNAEVVLPADWKPGTRLPTFLWIYPNDYRSAAAASQNRRSPNRFPSQSPLNPEVLVTQGYAVLYPDLAVVGSNDHYVDEVRLSAKAAIDEATRRGFCDPMRVAVGGHSYGAFSTVNLLAHTSFFRAGIASDGAYNRTLTPFTFQAEERTLWEARDTYLAMSPFLYADQIQAPLLLMHNLDDTNVGTHPMQSERLYDALNGLGKTVTLVEYPYEDHGPAGRESVLDYWARAIEWLDRYVKPAARPGVTTEPMGGTRP